MELKDYKTQFTAEEFLFREGEVGDCAYIVESGSVEVSVKNGDHKLVIAILGEGDLVGEMAIIDDLPRTASAMALEETQVIAIPLDYIRQKIDLSDPTVKFFLQIIMERYRDMHQRLMQVFEGIYPSEEAAKQMYATTTNVMKNLMAQYIDMQDRILQAVNSSVSLEEHKNVDNQVAKSARQVMSVENALQSALKNDEFELHFQPIVGLQTGNMEGCEALIRWHHPVKGLVPPAEFISLAESTGLIVDLGYWIAEQACNFQLQLKQQFETPMFVSINLSGKQFDDHGMIGMLDEILKRSGVEPALIKYEITETLLMANPEKAAEYLHRLKESGVKLAIDDFGTGYSSFSYLHRFPFDTLKIDRMFVSTMIQNKKSKKIVRSLVHLSHDIGMDVVAEGIETTHEHAALVDLGAEYTQGFFYSRPLDAESFLQLPQNALQGKV